MNHLLHQQGAETYFFPNSKPNTTLFVIDTTTINHHSESKQNNGK